MRFLRIFLLIFLVMLIIINIPSIAFSLKENNKDDKLFLKVDTDLKRVGIEEIFNMATVNFEDSNYRLDPDFTLGVGDVLTIDFWGKIEATHKLTIDSYGNILIPMVGRVSVLGCTLKEATSIVERAVEQKYSNVKFDLSLSDVRDIRVSVLGNVNKPGVYALSPFSRITEAFISAGGPTAQGTITDIRLIRNKVIVSSLNIYDYLYKGDEAKNLRLKHGDLIYVPQVQNLIIVRGAVNRPGVYEAYKGARLKDIIEMAGGMLDTKFERKIMILRKNFENKLSEIYKEIIFPSSEEISDAENVVIENWDVVIVTTTLDCTPYPQNLFEVVHISGEVKSPGDYFIKKGDTLSSILKRTGGLKETAYVDGAIFTRESIKEKHRSILDELIKTQEKLLLEEEARLSSVLLTNEEKILRINALKARREVLNIMKSRNIDGRIVVDIKAVFNGNKDILLEAGDRLFIPQKPDWVLVTGVVYNPNFIVYEEGKQLDYYLNITGGPMKDAAKDDIYIIKADGSVAASKSGNSTIKRGDIIVVPKKNEYGI